MLLNLSLMKIGDLVRKYPATISVLGRLGIDVGRNQHRSLQEACRRSRLNIEQVCQNLQQADNPVLNCDDRNWQTSLSLLMDHIMQVHHAYVLRELPRLQRLANHGCPQWRQQWPELSDLPKVLDALSVELLHHIRKEEMVLFPWIRQLEQGKPSPLGLRLEAPISTQAQEHAFAKEALARLRWLTGDYTPPAGAPLALVDLFHQLAAFDADLHLHIHEEDDILFPRALQLMHGREPAHHLRGQL